MTVPFRIIYSIIEPLNTLRFNILIINFIQNLIIIVKIEKYVEGETNWRNFLRNLNMLIKMKYMKLLGVFFGEKMVRNFQCGV